MKSQPDLTERLRVVADRLEIGPPPLERIARRGRRRFVTKAATSAFLVLVVGTVLVRTGLSLSGFREELRLGDGTSIPKPRLVATIPVTGVPWGVTFDGRSVWVSSQFDALVSRVDPKTDRETATIRTPGELPYEVAATHGAVWTGSDGKVLRIDTSGRAPHLADPIVFSGKYIPQAMASWSGSIWMTLDFTLESFPERPGKSPRGAVLRVDPRTGRKVPIAVEDPNDIAIGNGSVWVSTCHAAPGVGDIKEIDPGTNEVVASIRLPAPCVGALAIGNGYLYAVTGGGAAENDVQELWKVDLATRKPVIFSGYAGPGPLPLSRQTGTMVFYRGALWVITRGGRGASDSFVTVVDSTMRILTRVPVGQNAWRIAAGDDSLWVPAMKNGKPVLFRIKP